MGFGSGFIHVRIVRGLSGKNKVKFSMERVLFKTNTLFITFNWSFDAFPLVQK